MKHFMLALPATLLMAAAGIAQTETTADTSASGEFGTNWPLSVGTTFLTDDTNATVRPAEELSKGWQSLSREDQTMVRTDCEAFMAAHGDGTSDDASAMDSSTATTGTASTDTTTGNADAAAADTSGALASDATATESTGTDSASTDAAGDASTAVPAGYDLAEMRAICNAVGAL